LSIEKNPLPGQAASATSTTRCMAVPAPLFKMAQAAVEHGGTLRAAGLFVMTWGSAMTRRSLGRLRKRTVGNTERLARTAGDSARSDAPMVRWAAAAEERAVLERLDAVPLGLDEQEVARRAEIYGPNRVAREGVPRWWVQLYHAVRNPFVVLLGVIAGVSLFTGDREAATIIAVMVTLSVTLRFFQERRSIVAAGRLRAMVRVTAAVIRRNGAGVSIERELPIEELVPGDIVRLSAGDMVPADVRLLSAKDLFVSQSVLTGEALPVEKQAGIAPSASAMDAPNLCFLGTNVISGAATGVVVTTGARTYLGSLARTVLGARAQTSFELGVRSISWLLIRLTVVMTALVFVINGLGKHNWSEAFLFALSVAVGLTPEMLPMVVSGTLALGALSMARRKVIVKRQSAIQELGAMTVLCTDKTGTLTRDEVVLIRCCDVAGDEDNEAVFRLAYFNSYFQTGLKNLMDRAVLSHKRLPVDAVKKVDEMPFDFSRRMMSVVVDLDTSVGRCRRLITKGAPAEVLARSGRFALDGVIHPIEELLLPELRSEIEKLNRIGFRVLAVAYKDVDLLRETFTREDERDLVLLGYVAFLDPPKDTSARAIAVLQQHGITVKVLTGDNEVVTRTICRQVGLHADDLVTGADLERIDDATLVALARQTTIFARLTPTQKERVIRALRQDGQVVGFLGDGINDAPALRAADVGISVNNAVDIAKESADIILLEKSLLVLEDGVLEGRRVFGNIQKYIRMGLSSNFGNMFSVLGASVFLPFLPMLPIQILVQNLLYDISQMAIPFDRVDDEYLKKPRGWRIEHLARFMFCIGPISSIFDYTTFGLMWFVFAANTVAKQHVFQTGWFVEGLLSQTLIVHMIRTRQVPFLRSRAAWPLLVATLAVMAVGVVLPFTPLGSRLGMVALPAQYFGWLALTLVAYFFVTQVVKSWFAERFGFN
jgi:Mg2+-importing ATPase